MSDSPPEDGYPQISDVDPASIPTASPPPELATLVPPPESRETPSEKTQSKRSLWVRLLRRLVRRPSQQVSTDASEPPPIVISGQENRLLQHSPFATGFFAAFGVIVALTLYGAVLQVQNIVVLAVLSLFLALGLNPAVEFLSKRRVPRGLSVTIVTISGLGIVALGIWALVPIITEQVRQISDNVPFWLNNLLQNETIAKLNRDYHFLSKINDFLASERLIEQTFGGILGASKILANLVFSIIITLVLTIYFLASLPTIKLAIYRLAPASRRPRTKYLADEIFRGISGYLTGMFVIVSVAGTCSFIFMQFAGLHDYSLALAFVVALFCFIPLVGSSLAMFAVALVGFGVSTTTGVAAIIYFLAYQQFDAYVLYPSVMGRTVRVPGVLIVLSAIIGGILFGVIGALIAIPTAAAILLLYREVLLPHLDSQ